MALARMNSHKPMPRFWRLSNALLLISAASRLTDAAITSTSADHATQMKECPEHPTLTPQYWQERKLDDYLRNYPHGNTLTLAEYAQQLSTPIAFTCGVGNSCKVSTICHPVRGADWYILYATSQWNYYVNSLVTAFNASSKLAKSMIPELLQDFVQDYDANASHGELNEVDLIRILLSSIEAGGAQTNSTASTQTPDWEAAIEPINSNYSQALIPSDTKAGNDQAQDVSNEQFQAGPDESEAPVNPEAQPKPKSSRHMRFKRQLLPTSTGSNIPVIVYNSTQTVETNLVQLSTEFKHMLKDSITHKVNSPISLDAGIYPSLQGGRFLAEHVHPAGLAENAKDIVSLIGISALLKYENAMVLVRKSSCNKHRELYKPKKDALSFCASDGTLIEIVKVSGNTLKKNIYNGHLIKEKYGFSTSLLASEAWRCSQAGQDKPESEKFNDDKFDVCTFDLPVCNLTDMQNYEALSAEGESLAQICREAGLPI